MARKRNYPENYLATSRQAKACLFAFKGDDKKTVNNIFKRVRMCFSLLIRPIKRLPPFWAQVLLHDSCSFVLEYFSTLEFNRLSYHFFQLPRFPDNPGNGRTLISQPDPSPNTLRDQIRCKELLLRLRYGPKPRPPHQQHWKRWQRTGIFDDTASTRKVHFETDSRKWVHIVHMTSNREVRFAKPYNTQSTCSGI